jgi:HD-GYP domain-containing protein (c-di-GMP phosphodiesterase class II)
MSDTQALLHKIAALRKRLEQVRGLVNEAGTAIASMAEDGADQRERVRQLEQKVRAGGRHGALLDDSFRQWAGSAEGECLPSQWTARARRLLERGRETLRQLRTLADDFDLGTTFQRGTGAILPPRTSRDADPLADWFRDTVAMTDTTIRLMAALPNAPSGQLRFCPGLEAILEVIARRVDGLTVSMGERRKHHVRVDSLAELLLALEGGNRPDAKAFMTLADELLGEAQEGAAVRFLHASAEEPARFVASHSLVVAQVMARLIRHDPELQGKRLEPILAALVHDVGMLRVPVEILASVEPLTDAARRKIESHALVGGDLAARLWPGEPWLAQAAASHHERLDGTGYPAGLREPQISSMIRLLAVCDVYAAQCTPRPQRSAKDTRTALTDTLLLAEKGALDRFQAERLLFLSFYPIGSVVELADGAVGVVVATPPERRNLDAPARPVLALLTDSLGQPLPAPQHLDLAQCESRSILRCLKAADKLELLSRHYPHLAA